MQKLLTGLQRWIPPLSGVMNHIASVVLFLMMVLTILDVVLRKLASKSILGTVELSEFMLVAVVFFALAHTEVLDGHVKVDLILGRFSRRTQGIVDMCTQFICFVLSLLITWSSFTYSETMRLSKEVTQDLLLPKYPFIYIVGVGCLIFSITLLMKCCIAAVKVFRK